MVGEPKYVPAELYWFLNELLKKTKNDVVIAGWKALFGKDLNPTQIRYLKNKYGNDDVYNAPLSNKRLAYKWPEEAHQLCPGYKRDQRPDAEPTEALTLLAEKLLPYGVEANLCPEYPSTDYMRKVEIEGTPYHGPHLPKGSITFGRALQDGPPAQDRERQQSDAGPSSRTVRPGSGHMSRSQPGSSKLSMAPGLGSLARPGSSSKPHPSIENVRAVPSARSGSHHETSRYGMSTLNAPLSSGYQQQQRPQNFRSQHVPVHDQSQQMRSGGSRQHQQQQTDRAQQASGGICQLTQAQYQQILAAQAARNAGGQSTARGLNQPQHTGQTFVQGQACASQPAFQRAQALPFPLMQMPEPGAVFVGSDGFLKWSPSRMPVQTMSRVPNAVPLQAPARAPVAFPERQATQRSSNTDSDDESEVSVGTKRKRGHSPQMDQGTCKRVKLDTTENSPGKGRMVPSLPKHGYVTTTQGDPNTLRPLPEDPSKAGMPEPARQFHQAAAAETNPSDTARVRESTSVAAVTDTQFDNHTDLGLHDPFLNMNPAPFPARDAFPNDAANNRPEHEADPFMILPPISNPLDASLHSSVATTTQTRAVDDGQQGLVMATAGQNPSVTSMRQPQRSTLPSIWYSADGQAPGNMNASPTTPRSNRQTVSPFCSSALTTCPDPAPMSVVQQMSGAVNNDPKPATLHGRGHIRNISTSSITTSQPRPRAHLGDDMVGTHGTSLTAAPLSGRVQTLTPTSLRARPQSSSPLSITTSHQAVQRQQEPVQSHCAQGSSATGLPEDPQPALPHIDGMLHAGRIFGSGLFYQTAESNTIDLSTSSPAAPQSRAEALSRTDAVDLESALDPGFQAHARHINLAEQATCGSVLHAQMETIPGGISQENQKDGLTFMPSGSHIMSDQKQHASQTEFPSTCVSERGAIEVVEISSDSASEQGKKDEREAIEAREEDAHSNAPNVWDEDMFESWASAHEEELLNLFPVQGVVADLTYEGPPSSALAGSEGIVPNPETLAQSEAPFLTNSTAFSRSACVNVDPALDVENMSNFVALGQILRGNEPTTIDPSALWSDKLPDLPLDLSSFPSLDRPEDVGNFNELGNFDFSVTLTAEAKGGEAVQTLDPAHSNAYWEDRLQNLETAVNTERNYSATGNIGPKRSSASVTPTNSIVTGGQTAGGTWQMNAPKYDRSKSKDDADGTELDDDSGNASLFAGSIDWNRWDSLG